MFDFFKKNKNLPKRTHKLTPHTPQVNKEEDCGKSDCGCKEGPEAPKNDLPFADAAMNKGRGLNSIKHILAVASGKGGVGKSTVTSNLAHSLKKEGFRVGVLDADIYGPSQPMMLGHQKNDRPKVFDGMIRPLESNGIKYISMEVLGRGEGDPVVWRAPIALQAMAQFLHGVYWGELDYLLIDLPPGTGDIHITLAQESKISGALIVTTPQRVAVEVAKKGLKMFEEVKVPIVGVIENMSGLECGHCHKETKVFKGGGAKEMAKELNVPFLESIPLDPSIMMACDEGKAVGDLDDKSTSALAFKNLAQKVDLYFQEAIGGDMLKNVVINDKGILITTWSDGSEGRFSPYELRNRCECAQCIDEITGEKLLDAGTVPLTITINKVHRIGRYGLNFHFSDSHQSGIYSIDELAKQ
jgi:ATP-binding protein involved in chromosome partitioning